MMAYLEDLTRWMVVKGILPDGLVTVVDVKWIGNAAVELEAANAQNPNTIPFAQFTR